MANEERKIRYGIKGKLISAIAMLLVAVIMTVSSTYAWFTLSTAPEVTGISTAVGANGALEMVLLTKNDDGTWAYTTGTDIYGDKNTTWGNLVDLSNHANYGSNKIVLYPSALNTKLAGRVDMESPLYFPNYGVDGRVLDVNGMTMLAGNYQGNDGSFKQNDDFGFRAVGTTSGLSERQNALREATSQLNILKNQAKKAAEEALADNGSKLAEMAIKKVTVENPTFTSVHYNAVSGMITGLDAALAILDEAYQQAVLAWAASDLTSADDTVYNAVKAIVEEKATIEEVIAAVNDQFDSWKTTLETIEGIDLTDVTFALPEWIVGMSVTKQELVAGASFTIPTNANVNEWKWASGTDNDVWEAPTVTGGVTSIAAPTDSNTVGATATLEGTDSRGAVIAKYVFTVSENPSNNVVTTYTALAQYAVMKADVDTADTKLKALVPTKQTVGEEQIDTYTYAGLSDALQPLVNMNTLKVNDIALNSDGYKDAIMGSALANKAVWVSMATGSGVFADMADQCGDYQVSIQVDAGALLGAGSIMMDAAMLADTTLTNPYLQNAIDTAKATGAPANAAGETAFSEFYGYIIDLGFRTNAAASNLLLQQDAIDRIYADNNNEATMGHGSSMTFTSTSTGFSTDSVKDLMEHICIVFFDTEGENTILVYAKLDMTKATVSSGSVTAPMYLYETVDNAFTYDGTLNRTVYLKDGKYYWDEAYTMLATDVTSDKVSADKVAVENPVLYKVVTTTGGETPTTETKYYYDYYTNDASTLASDVDESKLTAQTDYEVVKTDNVITSLTQNAEKHISALVYLNGETITNADVAADAAASMTGTANFQFASDAALDPMDYGNLYHPDTTAPEANP
ncbi:MAG: hypothetical protein E7618_03155 [Ruminococcaceae bacterium]|nr:hypothetical protein [Oscillospiraceae bacterium]